MTHSIRLLTTLALTLGLGACQTLASPDDGDTSTASMRGEETRGWYLHKDGTLDTPEGPYTSMDDFLDTKPWNRGAFEKCQKGSKSTQIRDLGITARVPVTKSQSECTNSFTDINIDYQLDNSGTKLVVPVVFHNVMRADGTGLVSSKQLLEQINVLNEDFAAKEGTPGDSVLAVDTNIEFVLAGIDRHVNDDWFNNAGAADAPEEAMKEALHWDVDEYLNIYTVGPFGAFGFAYTPADAAGVPEWDGVVLDFQYVGRDDLGGANQGRTATHEVGHYLGLHHTFAPNDDDEGISGVCENGWSSGDLVSDTAPQPEADYGCPAAGTNQQCAPTDDTMNISNYMNYTEDACQDHFTVQQANRAVCGLVNYRPDLYLSVTEASKVRNYAKVDLYDNIITHPFLPAGSTFIMGAIGNVPSDANAPEHDVRARITTYSPDLEVVMEDFASGLNPAFFSYEVPEDMTVGYSATDLVTGQDYLTYFAIYE